MRLAEGWKVRKGLARRYEHGQLVEARTINGTLRENSRLIKNLWESGFRIVLYPVRPIWII